MRKVLVLAAAAVIILFGALNSEAGEWEAEYPFYDDASTVVDRFSWDGWNHLALTWNNQNLTASAIEMNPDGMPNIYYWGDIYDTVYPVKMYLYFSYDGYNWYYYDTYYYY